MAVACGSDKALSSVVQYEESAEGPVHFEERANGPVHFKERANGPVHFEERADGPVHFVERADGPVHFFEDGSAQTGVGGDESHPSHEDAAAGGSFSVCSVSANEMSASDTLDEFSDGVSVPKKFAMQPQVLVEVAIQVNDYDIERRSGRLPARRRVIPFKFRDYKNPDASGEDSSDSDYEPETEVRLPKKRSTGQKGPGRPKKQVEREEGVQAAEETASLNKPEQPLPSNSKAAIIKTAKGFKCGICSKVFTQKGNLVVHHRIHTGVKPYTCDFEGCLKTFRSNESLRRHKLAHFGIKPYECTVCGSKFSSSLARQEHMTRHSDEKPLHCEICQRRFRQVSCLRRHQVTHTQDMPFECELCHRRFSQKTYLRSHMKIHTGEKPYVCPQCDKAFAHQSDLARHKIIHTGQKPYGCDVCTARFSDASSRRRHVKEHLGHKPYTCSLCEETFKRAGQLRVHLGRKHTYSKGEIRIVKHGNTYRQIELSGHEDGSVDWMSLENQKKILDLIKKMNTGDPNIVVQQVEIAPTLTSPHQDDRSHKQALLEVSDSDLQITLEDQGEAQGEEIVAESDVGLEKTVIAITGTGDGSGSIPLEAYELIQELADESEDQQVFEVHYHSELDVSDMNYSQHVSQAGHSDTSDTRHGGHNQTNVVSEIKTEPLMEDYSAAERSSEQHHTSESSPASSNSHNMVAGETEQMPGNSKGKNQSDTPERANSDGSNESIDYVGHPDFNSQEYFNWLSSFTELCKVLPMPLNKSVFQKISQVHKTLSDFMAMPSGVISDKENFRVLMFISKDLNSIINEHLSFVLQTMDDDDER